MSAQFHDVAERTAARNTPLSNPSKYRTAHVIDAMRQAALGRWMEYLATDAEMIEAFAFAPIDASEPYYRAMARLAYEAVARVRSRRSREGVRVLDVGAGVGRTAFDISHFVAVDEVVAMESSPELVDEIEALALGMAREVRVPVVGPRQLRAVLRPPQSAPRMQAVDGDAENMPFDDGAFDVVLALGVFDRVVRPRQVERELFRITRPGGAALVSCLHDFAGGPARETEWVASLAQLFGAPTWECIERPSQTLMLRQNARFVERFDPEIVVLRRSTVL